MLAFLPGKLYGTHRNAGRFLCRRYGYNETYSTSTPAQRMDLDTKFVESQRCYLYDGSCYLVPTDVLAGAGINVLQKELRLAPVITDDNLVSVPLYYPNFWGVVTADPQTKSLKLKITKKYGKDKISFTKIISEPAGLPTTEKRQIEIKEFVVDEGKVLDLSQYWDQIVDNRLESPILPNADKHDFRYVMK